MSYGKIVKGGKGVKNKNRRLKDDDDFEETQACSLIHDKRFDALDLSDLDEEQANKVLELLEPVIIKNKDILKEIRLEFNFGTGTTTKGIILYP